MYEELKKCPFCGGKAAFHKVTVNDNGSVKDMYGVYCIDCKSHSEYCYSMEQAVEDWNSLRKMIMMQSDLDGCREIGVSYWEVVE